ncbi:GNAT family N-acetyltransferase [Kibdelosporangium philippinense]|uniref:GNAT family N-acetyltransferase n=1 Tax=Kibdelosporangium philippinense TaxID=211113 RepID=A0ABS8ZJK0_9PSEU|nr:GNAT family N-acetyltransferase [Kibdelosporangium philippinense]MCE7005997.1 GNAT family N-acetyltransferase [Kibdelosporangium philippinense]
MEPIEINAGGYYLRALRADDLLDDRPAILRAFEDPEMKRWVSDYRIGDLADAGAYVANRADEWARDVRCSWAVAEPTTGALLGEVNLRGLAEGDPQAACWTHPDHRGLGVATTALGAAVRFGFGALDLPEIGYKHDPDNTASLRVAEKCGFQFVGESEQDGTRLLHWVAVPPTP